MLRDAERPLVLMGRVARNQRAWNARVKLVENLGTCVLTDLKVGAVFPTKHPLHPVWPGTLLTPQGKELIQNADVILNLDWLDLGGTLQTAEVKSNQRVISCSNDSVLHNGWSKDHFSLPELDLSICADPNLLVDALLERSKETNPIVRKNWPMESKIPQESLGEKQSNQLLMSELSEVLQESLAGHKITWTGLPLGWTHGELDFSGPLDFLGRDGGGGVGAGPGLVVGAALALAGTDRIPVAVIGDGDYLMSSSALWTAAHHRLPLLVIVANNRSFYNDEVHQQRVAITRGRPQENRWVGQHLRDPDPDLAAIARGHGLKGYGPIQTPADLSNALTSALVDIANGDAVLIDVRVSPIGYQGAPPGTPNQGRG